MIFLCSSVFVDFCRNMAGSDSEEIDEYLLSCIDSRLSKVSLVHKYVHYDNVTMKLFADRVLQMHPQLF